jgi:hypothetical protein
MSGWQCPSRLHRKKHHPKLGELCAISESLFASGQRIGMIWQ